MIIQKLEIKLGDWYGKSWWSQKVNSSLPLLGFYKFNMPFKLQKNTILEKLKNHERKGIN